MYNYFGYSKFCQFITIWVDQGLLSEGWAKPHAPLLESFKYGIKENIVAHAQIEDLVKYSRFVKVRVNGHKINSFDVQISHFNSTLLLQFAIKVCAIFLSEFQEQKLLFPGVDGEAMFVGTVLYSLVHTFYFYGLESQRPALLGYESRTIFWTATSADLLTQALLWSTIDLPKISISVQSKNRASN